MKTKILLTLAVLMIMTATVYAQKISEEYGLIQAVSREEIPFGLDAKTVTRAEFVDAAVKAFGYKYTGVMGDEEFSDVNTDSEYYESICVAIGYDMIGSTGEFRPNAPVTLAEAVRICTGAAGYSVWAQQLGGYPNGYISAAQQTDILKNVKSENQIDAGCALRLIYNTLKAPMLTWDIGVGGVDFSLPKKDRDKSILNTIYDIYETEGVVNAGSYTRLGGKASFVEGTLEIEGVYFSADKNYNDFVGQNVSVYYEDNKGDYKAVYIHPKKNKILTLKADDYISFENNVIEDEHNKKDYKIKQGFDFIYNNESCVSYTDGDIIPECGYITIIDNDSDGYYDIIFAYDFKYLKAVNVNKINGVIRGKKEIIDTSDGDCTYLIYDGDEIIQPYEIEPDWLLAYAYSKDKTLCTVRVCRTQVNGTVEVIENTDKKITLDGQVYDYGKHFEENSLGTLSLMTKSTFWLGINGELVEVAEASSHYLYAYLIGAFMDDTGEELTLKLYTQQGVFEKLLCAEKVTVDGNGKYNANNLLAKLSGASGVIPQLIRYQLNDRGFVAKVDLKENGTDLIDKDKINDDNCLTEYNFAGTYNYRQSVFYPYFNINSSVIFKVPRDVTKTKLFDIGAHFSDGAYNNITPYDVDYSGTAGAIVYKSDAASSIHLDAENIAIIVEKVIDSVDDEGEVSKTIYGWEAQFGNGATPVTSYVEYWVDEDIDFTRDGVKSEIKSGDLIRASLEGKRIVDAVLDFDGEALKINTGGTSPVAPFNSVSSVFQYQAGSVYSMDGEYLYLSNQKNGDDFDYSLSYLKNVHIPSTIIIYDRKTKKLTSADATYIYDAKNHNDLASYVVIKQHYLYSNFAIIFK